MQLMVKGGVKRWVPDVFIGYYRELGYTVEGEETPPLSQEQPETVIAIDASEQPAAETPEEEVPAAQEEAEPAGDAEEQAETPEEEAAEEEPEPAEPTAFKCPYCDKEYKTESALKGHITRSHSGEQ